MYMATGIPFFRPFRFTFFRDVFDLPVTILDVGCGSSSPRITKAWFRACTYHGIDMQNYANTAEDIQAIDRFFSMDIASLEEHQAIPERFYDIIILSHIIEHIPNGVAVIQSLTTKLKPHGQIYIEYPCAHALSLPSMPGSLHFSDDPTHIRCYTIPEIANALMMSSMRIVKAGRRRDRVRIALFPLLVPLKLLLRGKLSGGDFWDICGFAEYIVARKSP